MTIEGFLHGIKDRFKLKDNAATLLIGDRDRAEFYVPIETHISQHISEILAFSCYRMPGDAERGSDVEDVQQVIRKGTA